MALAQLHVYDVVQPSRASNSYIRTLNNVGSSCGLGGVFHAGVELFDLEWSFGYCPAERGTGVYCCKPKSNPQYQYRETVTLGISPLSKQQVQRVIAELQQAWQGKDYELLTRNCLHFCNALCAKLEVPEIPAHLNRLAYGADTVVTFANNAVEQAQWLSSAASAWWNRSPSQSAAADADAGHLKKSGAPAKEAGVLPALPKLPVPPAWQ